MPCGSGNRNKDFLTTFSRLRNVVAKDTLVFRWRLKCVILPQIMAVVPSKPVISLRKFADHIGCVEGTVRAAIREGKIAAFVVKDEVTGKVKGIMWREAELEWARVYHHGKGNIGQGAGDGLARVSDEIRDIQESRAAKEHYQAELSRLEFEEAERVLLRKDDVERQLYGYAKEVSVELKAVGRLCAPDVVGLTDIMEVERVVGRYIDAALNKLTEVVERDFN